VAPFRVAGPRDRRGVDRDALGPIDLAVGCGDLSPAWLCFLGDAFCAPLVYVRGNHDRQGSWPTPADLPEPRTGFDDHVLPLPGDARAAVAELPARCGAP
jgi:hypothetical protein